MGTVPILPARVRRGRENGTVPFGRKGTRPLRIAASAAWCKHFQLFPSRVAQRPQRFRLMDGMSRWVALVCHWRPVHWLGTGGVMATRFVRIDLSDGARDFRPLAIEPGLAMLDKGGANARILFRWIGGMAAEPVWEGRIRPILRPRRPRRTAGGSALPAGRRTRTSRQSQGRGRPAPRADPARPSGNAQRTILPQDGPANAGRPLGQPRPDRPGQLLLPLSGRGKPLAAGVVLGLSAGRIRSWPRR